MIRQTKHFVDAEGNYIGTYEIQFDGDNPVPGSVLPPEGSVEVPSAPQDASQKWLGAGWGPVSITSTAVIAERARRLAQGFDYDFEDARGVRRIGTTEADMKGWDEVSKLASALLALNDTTTTISIVTDTGPVSVTAMEWQQILLASASFRQPIWAASFVLQAMDPIPSNYTDDSWWE